jgi:predicted nucleic acid-binding Zn ribbon protein
VGDGPEPLKNVLAQLFATRGWGAAQSRLQLESAWRAAAGDDVAQSTHLGSLRKGTLEVLVSDSVLLHELRQFRREALLRAVQDRLGNDRVRELRFKLGR